MEWLEEDENFETWKGPFAENKFSVYGQSGLLGSIHQVSSGVQWQAALLKLIGSDKYRTHTQFPRCQEN